MGCGVVRAPASIGSVVVVVVDCNTGKVPSSMVVVFCGMIMSPANVVVVVSCGMIMSPSNTGSVVVVVGCGVVRAPSNMASVVVVVTGGVEIVVSCGIDAAPLSVVVVCAVVVVVPGCGGSTGVTGKFPHPFKSVVAASSVAAFAR